MAHHATPRILAPGAPPPFWPSHLPPDTIAAVPPTLLPTLPRYVLREVLKMYGAGLALLLALQLADTLGSTLGQALAYRATAAEGVMAFFAILPTILNRALVLAVPFAILLGLSRLQRDSELKAALAAGVRPLSLVWPLLLPFTLVGVLAFWNAGTVVPAGLDRWDRTWFGIFNMPEKIPTRDNYTYAPPGALYYAGRVTQAGVTQTGVTQAQVTQARDTQAPQGRQAQLAGVMVQTGGVVYTANSGVWDAAGRTWTLDSPWVTAPGQRPRQQAGPVTLPQTDALRPPPAEAKKVSNAALRTALAGTDLSTQERRDYTYQLASRYADPFTPVAFALAAAALGLLIRNQAAALAAVIVFIAGFYVLWITIPQLARAGALDPALAAWVPSLVFALLGLGLAWRVNR